MNTSRPVRFFSSSRSLSTSVPFRPMMMPGRAVYRLTLSFCSPARSIIRSEMPA